MRWPRPVRLDFVAQVQQSPLAGAALFALGLLSAMAVGVAFEHKISERSQLEAARGTTAPPRHRPPNPESLKLAAEAAAVERELGIPWTRLLSELEGASRDSAGSVSLLEVEPDPGKQLVRITAEVRTLNDALAYLKRLQKSPMSRSRWNRSLKRPLPDSRSCSTAWLD